MLADLAEIGRTLYIPSATIAAVYVALGEHERAGREGCGRGIDRGGAKERFRKQRASERPRSGRRGG